MVECCECFSMPNFVGTMPHWKHAQFCWDHASLVRWKFLFLNAKVSLGHFCLMNFLFVNFVEGLCKFWQKPIPEQHHLGLSVEQFC